MSFVKKTKMWLTLKLLHWVREAIEEEMEEYTDEEMEKVLQDALDRFYEENDLSECERELVDQFIEYAKGDLVPYLVERLEAYLREKMR